MNRNALASMFNPNCHSADEAIAQIKERRYWEKVADYSGDVLLVGICYDKEAKTHDCIIESLTITH